MESYSHGKKVFLVFSRMKILFELLSPILTASELYLYTLECG